MKNLHLIPTDKPSKLFKDDFGKYFISINIDQEQNHFKPQHIYITSDEEIKEGDYFLYDGIKIRYKSNGTEYHGRDLCHISGNHRYPVSESKKIILTTDQDLIEDGVQAIDDEFLEWFVKNPSCEEVEVELHEISFVVPDNIYKIIIPQEEPKQETLEKYHGNTVEYWKQNAEENYLTTPISVLKYITVLEEQAEQLREFKKKGGDK